MSDIHLIPNHLHCPKCNHNLGNVLIILYQKDIYCENCRVWITFEELAKQFGVIKNVAE